MMEDLTLDRYINGLLPAWEFICLKDCPSDYADQVVWPWFNQIAPVKAKEYGIECWQRLGVRALVVDTNACFYRWKRLRALRIHPESDVYLNALRDCFGYSVMIGVLQYGEPQGDAESILKYQWSQHVTADFYNDQLVDEVWWQGITSMAFVYAMRMSYAMFKES